MNFNTLENIAKKYFDQINDSSVSLNKFEDLIKRAPDRENVANVLDIMNFRTIFLEILPTIIKEYSNKELSSLSERMNKISKRYKVEALLQKYGGVYISADKFDMQHELGDNYSSPITYTITSTKFSDNPTTYQTSGNIRNIINPSSSYSVFGRTYKEFTQDIRIEIPQSCKSIFLDISNSSATITGNSKNIDLNDGWTNVDLSRGIYTIHIKPNFLNGSFNYIIRQLIFTADFENKEEFTYTKTITHNENFGIRCIGGKNVRMETDEYSGGNTLYVGKVGDQNGFEIYNVDPSVDHHVDIDINVDSGQIGTTDIESGTGIIVSEDIVSGNIYSFPLFSYVSGMFYTEGIKTPIEGPSSKVFRIDHDVADELTDIDLTTPEELTEGLYRIVSTFPTENLGQAKNWLYKLTHTSVLLPVKVINSIVYSEYPPQVLKSLGMYVPIFNDIWFQSRSLSSNIGKLIIRSETPIDGILLI